MRSLQDWVYEVEAGWTRLLLVRVALLLIVFGLAAWIGLREFNGLRTMEAMDLAQQGRQLALGKGFTTKMIRPLALWQLRANKGNQAPSMSEFPETLTPPLYPLLLSGVFRLGKLSKVLDFEVPPEKAKGFSVYAPDYVPLGINMLAIIFGSVFVFLWGAKQFDLGVGILSTVFFLGCSVLWDYAIQGGSSCLVVFLYGVVGWISCGLMQDKDQDDIESKERGGAFWTFLCGFVFALLPLVQIIQIWPCLFFLVILCFNLRRNQWAFLLGAMIPLGIFLAWLGKLWLLTGNPVGLNWAYFLWDSSNYPGNMVWRTFSFDIEKTNVWRRVTGSVLKGLSLIVGKGPGLCGGTVVGALALVSLLHHYRQKSAALGRNVWGIVAITLVIVCSFVFRDAGDLGSPILIALLPAACVYGSAFLWISIERWKFEIDLLGKLVACVVALVACSPTLVRFAVPESPPFSYPPNYPPIFIFMRTWFEPNELQASDLPWAEAWYADTPTLWIPTTRDDFMKIHDRVSPIFSILFTPMSSDVKMYSQMLNDNSEWGQWADLIRRQKPPDLPQAFATSLPPNNDYLLLSLQKRWN